MSYTGLTLSSTMRDPSHVRSPNGGDSSYRPTYYLTSSPGPAYVVDTTGPWPLRPQRPARSRADLELKSLIASHIASRTHSTHYDHGALLCPPVTQYSHYTLQYSTSLRSVACALIGIVTSL